MQDRPRLDGGKNVRHVFYHRGHRGRREVQNMKKQKDKAEIFFDYIYPLRSL